MDGVKLTNAQFAGLCASLAKTCASWAADSLVLPEFHSDSVGTETVARFTDEMRARLNWFDERAGRKALGDDNGEA